ncbi:MAG: GAF domain-containing sensor histidine kinase [Deltaproteobacteria bacterium]|nr:GAF domain-containing sensor histidine kinase [Deltaproteobacteria bacterium]MBW1736015.1 GAF domain-containing sensor histidine kinase [Deltaproteobacteria bacterium]MBW1910234.1 GAF domain-containing sensor histidine kinase [Deltaproteobacteria bacterium]MBW2032321.1 GAF domain-containing sensor histidine kinase [Deltaproteobacteria bacterium]MBW2113307.1 GAF domain-containing sensor histidine kinase [Deltaproteobacteria bacterium]
MDSSEQQYVEERCYGRRKEDWVLRDLMYRHKQLLSFGQIITSEMNMEVLFEVIMVQTNQIMDTQRSTVFLHDDESRELWALVATSMKRNEIRIPDDYGVAGWVFQHNTPLTINDVYNDPRFYSEVDKKSGFRTNNIICIPLINKKGKCIGTLQALNRNSGDFTDDDRELLTSVSHYVAVALENAKLYEDLKVLDKAKERVINHLSHELKTPMAIISGVLGRVSRELKKENITALDKAINRGQRNLNRLMDLQSKIDDILNQKPVEEKERIINIIEGAAGFVEELSEEGNKQHSEILDAISRRIESLFVVDEIHMEKIQLDEFLDAMCDEAISLMRGRDLEIVRNFEKKIALNMDRDILKKVCGGLLKNAVENMPDEGKIEIRAGSGEDGILIEFHDYGVGITPQNQEMVFGGFFHTQDTDFYSSKRPYEFNAGGSGSDLLRAKAFSERYGFSVDFNSSRCKFIPGDSDMCPGRISACEFITDKSECFESGGSAFSVKFPSTKSAK